MRKKNFDEDYVLKEAMHVFWENGYEGASVNELEERTGIKRTSLYNAYGSKEGLFLRVLDIYIAERTHALIDIVQSDAPLLTIMDQLFDTILIYAHEKGRPVSCMISVNSIEMKSLPLAVQTKIQEIHSGFIVLLKELFEKHQCVGALKSNIAPEELATYFASVIQGIFFLARVLDGKVDARLTKKQAMEHMESMIVV